MFIRISSFLGSQLLVLIQPYLTLTRACPRVRLGQVLQNAGSLKPAAGRPAVMHAVDPWLDT